MTLESTAEQPSGRTLLLLTVVAACATGCAAKHDGTVLAMRPQSNVAADAGAPNVSKPVPAGRDSVSSAGSAGPVIDSGTSTTVANDAAVSGSCAYEGTRYPEGTVFATSDDCDECICRAGGVLECTHRDCSSKPEPGTSADTDAGPTNDTALCGMYEPGQLCVLGRFDGTGYALDVGDKLKLAVYPLDCLSPCARLDNFTCSISGTQDYVVTSQLCIAHGTQDGPGCRATQCGTIGTNCESSTGLTAGTHTVRLNDMTVEFTVPGAVPAFGKCGGMPPWASHGAQ